MNINRSEQAAFERIAAIAAIRLSAHPEAKFLGIQEVAAQLGWSLTKAHRMVKRPDFPAPLDLPGDAQWREQDIIEWSRSLV